jgi:prefoldin subunit 5
VFIVVSTAIRMKNGEWLRKAGPFEVSETALSDIETQLEKWQRASEVGQEEVAELTERIKDSDELIEQLQNELQDSQRSQ